MELKQTFGRKGQAKQNTTLQMEYFGNGVFMGQTQRGCRIGLGVFLSYDGHFIIGHFDKVLQGRAIVFLPSEGVLYCHYDRNQLNGPAVLKYPWGGLLCCELRAGKLQGKAFKYDNFERKWQQLHYSNGVCENTRISYRAYQGIEPNSMPQQLKRTVLGQMCQELLDGKYFFSSQQESTKERVGMVRTFNKTYYGCLSENREFGLGILMTNGNSYCGLFKGTQLDGLVRITFQDKTLYIGCFQKGVCAKKGFSYSHNKRSSTVYQCEEGVEKIIQQVPHYSQSKLEQVNARNFPKAKGRSLFNLPLLSWFEQECFHLYRHDGRISRFQIQSQLQPSMFSYRREEKGEYSKFGASLEFSQEAKFQEDILTFRNKTDQETPLAQGGNKNVKQFAQSGMQTDLLAGAPIRGQIRKQFTHPTLLRAEVFEEEVKADQQIGLTTTVKRLQSLLGSHRKYS